MDDFIGSSIIVAIMPVTSTTKLSKAKANKSQRMTAPACIIQQLKLKERDGVEGVLEPRRRKSSMILEFGRA